MYLVGSRSDESISRREGWQDGDAAFLQNSLTTCWNFTRATAAAAGTVGALSVTIGGPKVVGRARSRDAGPSRRPASKTCRSVADLPRVEPTSWDK